jgi:hypothetical protein
MKSLPIVVAAVVLTPLLASCSLPWSPIEPGTRIGKMEVLDFCDGPNISKLCSWDELDAGDCIVPAGMDQFWISTGWEEETTEALETSWLDSEWSMTLDGRKVDLAAFGTFDMNEDGLRQRVWDICLRNPSPGEHVVMYDFYMPNGVERGNHQARMIFTVMPAVAGSAP